MVSCGNPAVEQDALMPRRKRSEKGFCVKCKEMRAKVVVRHSAYCKDCFFSNFTHKSRKSLDPYIHENSNSRRAFQSASGNLCIGFSGGLGSTVLLDWMTKVYYSKYFYDPEKGGKDHPRHIPIWHKTYAVYVECSSAFDGMRDRTEEVRQAVSNNGFFDFKAIRLEDAFDSEWWRSIGQDINTTPFGVCISNEDLQLVPDSCSDQNPTSRLRNYLSLLPTQTAILSTIQTLVRQLLAYTADSLDCSHLLLGTSLTTLSVNLISSISQGGGFVIRDEAQEEWKRPDSRLTKSPLRILRPLRDVGTKECAMWAWWNQLLVVAKERLPGSRKGIGTLTKDFIVGLERDYPSTVSTIVRTCGKLAPKELSSERCSLCQRTTQGNAQEWKSRISIRSYESLGEGAPPHAHYQAPDTQETHSPTLAKLLCYACHTTLTSKSSRDSQPKSSHSEPPPLIPPIWVGNEVWRSQVMTRDEKKAAISGFLL